MEAVAAKKGHGKCCGPRGGPIGGVYGTAESRTFYRTPAGYTAEKKTRRKRIGVARSSYLFLTSLSPLPPFSPHTARLLHCLGLRYQD